MRFKRQIREAKFPVNNEETYLLNDFIRRLLGRKSESFCSNINKEIEGWRREGERGGEGEERREGQRGKERGREEEGGREGEKRERDSK